MMYEKGRGVPQDFAKAAELYRQAAQRGYGGAQNNLAIAYALGRGVPKDPAEAYVWFALAEAHGDKNRPELREEVTKQLTKEQIAQAEKRVRELKL
jgi:TPR repeat protein